MAAPLLAVLQSRPGIVQLKISLGLLDITVIVSCFWNKDEGWEMKERIVSRKNEQR